MHRDPVKSSNLASVGYDSESNILEVEFLNRSVYEYYNVPQRIYEQLMRADSKGKYFNAYIRNSFRYRKTRNT